MRPLSRRNHGKPQAKRAAFSLLELLVVLAVLGLLFSLLAPAIHYATESARCARCRVNLKQIGVALTSFAAANNRLPSARGEACRWPGLSPAAQAHPFLVGDDSLSIPLGEICDGAIYEKQLHAPSILHCPSDGLAEGAAMSYRFNKTQLRRGIGPFASNTPTRLSEFSDGLAATALASERPIYLPSLSDAKEAPLSILDGNTPCNRWNQSAEAEMLREPVGASWVRGTTINCGYTHEWPPNVAWRDCAIPWENGGSFYARSRHDQIVNVLMGDGSVRSCRNQVALAVWRAAGTMAGDENYGPLGD
jgi:prepilin-type N-terminal cleavage/methylation domain-containing protein